MEKYILAKTLEEALDVLEKYGNRTRVIAGGTDLILLLKDGKTRPDYVLDITNITGLNYIRGEGNLIKVGALATHNDVATSPIIKEKATILAEASNQAGSPQVRNRGTLVGNIANASPAADAALALIALDAEAIVVSKGSQRIIKVADLFVGPGQTNLTNQELITELRFQGLGPQQAGEFIKLAQRRALATSVVNTAVVITIDKNKNLFKDARIGIGAVAPTPLRAREAEKKLIGHPISDETIENASLEAAREVSPIDDIRGCADYRSQMTKVLVSRAIKAALGQIK